MSRHLCTLRIDLLYCPSYVGLLLVCCPVFVLVSSNECAFIPIVVRSRLSALVKQGRGVLLEGRYWQGRLHHAPVLFNHPSSPESRVRAVATAVTQRDLLKHDCASLSGTPPQNACPRVRRFKSFMWVSHVLEWPDICHGFLIIFRLLHEINQVTHKINQVSQLFVTGSLVVQVAQGEFRAASNPTSLLVNFRPVISLCS